jgi:hypothetical protein
MIQLARLFENHFNALQISAEDLRDFASDFHGRLTARGQDAGDSNSATYAALASSIQLSFDTFNQALNQRQFALASQQAGTISKDEALQFIHATIRQREGRIRDVFGKGSTGYEAFFPKGLTQYARAPIGRIPDLLDQFIAAATTYEVQTGADLLTEFRTLKDTFTSARDRQVSQKGGVSEARALVTETRSALERELGLAVLELAKLHLNHPERAREFFNQALLDDSSRSQKNEAGLPTAP